MGWPRNLGVDMAGEEAVQTALGIGQLYPVNITSSKHIGLIPEPLGLVTDDPGRVGRNVGEMAEKLASLAQRYA